MFFIRFGFAWSTVTVRLVTMYEGQFEILLSVLQTTDRNVFYRNLIFVKVLTYINIQSTLR